MKNVRRVLFALVAALAANLGIGLYVDRSAMVGMIAPPLKEET